jgi:hypothetical protein
MPEAETIVQKQVEAYNARDVEHFADCYADDAAILGPDRSVMAASKAEIMKLYSQLFEQSPMLHAEVVARMTVGEFVIDEERVSGLVFEGMPPQLHAAVIYRVTEGKISQVQLLM